MEVAEPVGQRRGESDPQGSRLRFFALVVGPVDALKEPRADGTAVPGTLALATR
jgi:hypothetical protein